MKYVVLTDGLDQLHVLVFDEALVHSQVVPLHHHVVSAGFCARRGDGTWHTWGDSESLQCGPNDDDAWLIKLAIDHDVSGSDLENFMSLIELGQLSVVEEVLKRMRRL